jgi:hypothetical protein
VVTFESGVIMAARGPKGQQKYNKNRIFTAIAPTLAHSISSPIRDRICRSVNIPTKKTLTLWNNFIKKA